MFYTRASRHFFTVDRRVVRHGRPRAITDIFSFICSFWGFSLCFYKKSATICTFYVGSSNVIYINYLYPRYIYVAQHFFVYPIYSCNAPRLEALFYTVITIHSTCLLHLCIHIVQLQSQSTVLIVQTMVKCIGDELG